MVGLVIAGSVVEIAFSLAQLLDAVYYWVHVSGEPVEVRIRENLLYFKSDE